MASASSGPSAVGFSSADSSVPPCTSASASGIKRPTASEVPYSSGMSMKKIGHRGVDSSGETTYKKTTSSALKGAIQLGITHTVGSLSTKPERDVLMQDFYVVESIFFPSEGSNLTPAHHYNDFRFKTYAPVAFRYFRELFGIRPDDYLYSLCNEPLIELCNSGASGSLFYVSSDDEFIIKTVQHKEAEFLQKLLPGYYMNLNQNPRTLLPKFYGLYCVQAGGKNIRIVVMNNLLPRSVKMHIKYDLKGSTYKRRASQKEREKPLPTLKDLDFLQDIPDGLFLDADMYNALCKTLQRDCLVLQSFKIMDYSLLVSIHNIDHAQREPLGSEAQYSADLADQPRKRLSIPQPWNLSRARLDEVAPWRPMTIWVASRPGIVKGKGCCFISGSLTFCSLTGLLRSWSILGKLWYMMGTPYQCIAPASTLNGSSVSCALQFLRRSP